MNPTERDRYYASLPDRVIRLQLARARETDEFQRKQALRMNKPHTPASRFVALEAENRRRKEAEESLKARMAT